MNPAYFAKVAEHLGGWPISYLSLDVETNGFISKTAFPLPVEFGWVSVHKGRIASSGSFVLNWADGVHGVDHFALVDSLNRTRESMESKGNQYRFTVDVLRTGRPPLEALREVSGLIAAHRVDGYPIVGHKVYDFDVRVIHAACKRAGVGMHPVPAFEILDTMLVERGRLADDIPQKYPSRSDWYDKMSYARKGKSNLSHCADLYGVTFDRAQSHGALADSMTVHGLVEAMGVYARNRVVHRADDLPLFRTIP